MADDSKTIPITDITGALSFLHLKGIEEITFKTLPNGRVIGEAPATSDVYRLLAEFQSNPIVPLNEFLSCQRRLRGQMLDLRGGNGRNGYRRNGTNGTSTHTG